MARSKQTARKSTGPTKSKKETKITLEEEDSIEQIEQVEQINSDHEEESSSATDSISSKYSSNDSENEDCNSEEDENDEDTANIMAGLAVFMAKRFKLNAHEVAKAIDHYKTNILEEENPYPIADFVKQEKNSCDHVFTRNSKNHKQGDVCGEPVKKDGKCSTHSKPASGSSSSSSSSQEEKASCDHKLTSGKRSGELCGKPVKENGKCGLHKGKESSTIDTIFVEDEENDSELSSESFEDDLKETCKHLYTRGEKKGTRCDKDAVKNGLCKGHEKSKTFVPVKKSEVESEENDEYFGEVSKDNKKSKTNSGCVFVASRGPNKNKSCGKKRINESLFCQGHKNTDFARQYMLQYSK